MDEMLVLDPNRPRARPRPLPKHARLCLAWLAEHRTVDVVFNRWVAADLAAYVVAQGGQAGRAIDGILLLLYLDLAWCSHRSTMDLEYPGDHGIILSATYEITDEGCVVAARGLAWEPKIC